MSHVYYRPIPLLPGDAPAHALPLAGGPLRFVALERLSRDVPAHRVGVDDLPTALRRRLTAPRPPVAGLSLSRPRIMGILNVTPDSFSDGGLFDDPDHAVAQARALRAAGADMLDIGGESTRPGAAEVPLDEEIARTAPVIAALTLTNYDLPVSIDTRKAAVARAALDAGAVLVNDVSGFDFDPELGGLCALRDVPACLMHAQGLPADMQDAPSYGNVVLDVYDGLERRVQAAESIGISRDRIFVDPGIGFGKTPAHNMALLRGLSLFHGLGCPILLGASRKSIIGHMTGERAADRRMPGSVATALFAAQQGVQLLRVHDVEETHQALAVWSALSLI